MEFINFQSLTERLYEIKNEYQSQKPFRYVMLDNFFHIPRAELIHKHYPSLKNSKWNSIGSLDRKNKFRKATFEDNHIMEKVFKELNSPEFLYWLQEVTQIEEPLTADEELLNAGLHQATNGSFVNIHIDYNRHPKTKYHNRLNVVIYMNQNWKEEYEGQLELWDFSKANKVLLEKFSPVFNRCIIFETNETSYHGYPKPLNTPKNINRKSLTTYYYTKTRPANETAKHHNTIYVNMDGTNGQLKRISSGIKAIFDKVTKR